MDRKEKLTMNKMLRFFTLIVVIALAAISIAPAARAADTVNLTLMGWAASPAEDKGLQTVVDAWNKANPGIQVKLNTVPDFDTTLQKALASGTPPDLFYIDSSNLFGMLDSKAIMPIGDKLTGTDDFVPALKDIFTVDKTFYCPPKDFSTLALFINTDMWAKAGLKDTPKTWDELKAAAKALTTKDVFGMSVSADFARLIAFIYQADAKVTDDGFSKMMLDTPEAKSAITFYSSLITDGVAATPKQLSVGWTGEAFYKGKAAMVVEGNWLVNPIKDNAPDMKYTVVELPAGPKGTKATMAFTVCYGVAAGGKNIEATTKFVDWLTGPEGMKTYTDTGLAMPARKSLAAGWLAKFPAFKTFVDSAAYARRWGFVAGFNKVFDEAGKQLDLIFQGNTTIDEAVTAINKIGNEVLAARMKK